MRGCCCYAMKGAYCTLERLFLSFIFNPMTLFIFYVNIVVTSWYGTIGAENKRMY